MQITSAKEHKKILEKYKKREINLFVATDYFLKYFWTSRTAGATLKSMGLSVKYVYIIGIISSMRFIIFLLGCITSILYVKWLSLFIIPILIILFGLFLNIAARKKPNLLLAIIIIIGGIIIIIKNQEKGLWFQIMAISISMCYFFMEFTQYITNMITTYLLLTNYNFFDFFQSQKVKFDHPFFYIEGEWNREEGLGSD